MSFDSLATQFRDSLTRDGDNKPDFKELDLNSPVSPLPAARAAAPATSSSSSSSSGSVSGKPKPRSGHSGELTASSETTSPAQKSFRPGHRRSVSAGHPLIYAGQTASPSSSPASTFFPTGNICPSGKPVKTGMATRLAGKPDVLGSGTANYGHGNIMRGGARDPSSDRSGSGYGPRSDPEEVKRMGNELYRRGSFAEALAMYDRAISASPENAACRSNRAAALTALGRLSEAVRECEEAVRLDRGYSRAHQRLASLYLRFGQVESARSHLCFPGQIPDHSELQKMKSVENHLKQCAEARELGDWKTVLRESDAALTAGADSSPQLYSCKAEALLKLHHVDEAESCLSNIHKLDDYPSSCLHSKFLGVIVEAYVHYVRAQVEMALGRFESAVSAAEKAGAVDYSNLEVARVLMNVKMVARARSRGNDLFSAGRFAEACSAYGEGLEYDVSNSVLYCNRAVCWSKLGLWEKSVEDCNRALKIQPNYTKALLRRAVSNAKLERWAEAVRDYEVLRRELPGDGEVSESLHRAQIALKKSHGEGFHSKRFDGEVEAICSLEKFRSAISSPYFSVVHFKLTSNEHCDEISPFVNTLCVRYPSVKFFKVDVEEAMTVAKSESIRTVPAFKIYKNGERVKEMIRPNHHSLEESVKSCVL